MSPTQPRFTRRSRLLVLVGVALLLAGGALVGTAQAGDSPATFEFVVSEEPLEPGATTDVDVVVFSDGGFGDVGVASATFAASYDPAVATVSSVEQGPYLEDDGVDVVADIEVDNEGGLVTVQQERDPVRNGSTGRAVLATLTIEIDEDAGEDVALNFTENQILMSNDVSWPYIEYNQTVPVETSGTDAVGPGFGPGSAMFALMAVAVVAVVGGGALARRR